MSDKINFLQAIPYYIRATQTGGPAPVAHRLSQALLSRSAVTVLTTNGELDRDVALPGVADVLEVDEQGVPAVYLRRSRRWLPPTYYYAPKLSAWLGSHLKEFDVVIVHGTWTYFSWKVPQMCRKLGKPYLAFLHGSLDPWALNYRRIKKLPYWHLVEKGSLKRAAGIIALSQDEVAQARAMGLSQPAFIARNALLFPLPRLDQPRARIAQAWPEMAGAPYVFFMSRLHPKKGLDILLEAWAQLTNQYPGWRLVIAGPDENGYLQVLRQAVDRLGLRNTVRFVGLVSGDLKTALLQNAAIFTLPSYSEGVPTAVIEALGYGVPVVLTPGCHLPEVAEAQAGLVVAPEAPAVAAGLERLMADADLRRQMGQNAEKLALTEFDQMKVAAGLVDFCQGLLKDYLKK
ncbi:MAG: glycosyltransferase [Anaerolineales bacterium]|nr:glycosyltransferase [Anaerolineales bacterium]